VQQRGEDSSTVSYQTAAHATNSDRPGAEPEHPAMFIANACKCWRENILIRSSRDTAPVARIAYNLRH
jgi:hypothetical protein